MPSYTVTNEAVYRDLYSHGSNDGYEELAGSHGAITALVTRERGRYIDVYWNQNDVQTDPTAIGGIKTRVMRVTVDQEAFGMGIPSFSKVIAYPGSEVDWAFNLAAMEVIGTGADTMVLTSDTGIFSGTDMGEGGVDFNIQARGQMGLQPWRMDPNPALGIPQSELGDTLTAESDMEMVYHPDALNPAYMWVWQNMAEDDGNRYLEVMAETREVDGDPMTPMRNVQAFHGGGAPGTNLFTAPR